MREVTRYALTAQGRVAMLHDGAALSVQRVLLESDALVCSVLATRAGLTLATARRRVSAMAKAKLLRRVK